VLEASLESRGATGAVVTSDGRLVELVADPNHFFRLGKGAPTTQLTQLLPVDLVAAFTSAVLRHRESGEGVSFTVRGVGDREVILRLVPLAIDGSGSDHLLLELQAGAITEADTQAAIDEVASRRIRELQQEVRSTRETLQSAIEELQSTNEEQQSTNQELVAANEELQSTNEELHSVNEELYTVNQEYQRKNDDLITTTADLENLLRSTEIATLFLDAKLRVRRFSAGVERVVRLAEHDVGLSIREFEHRMFVDFVGDAAAVLERGVAVQREIRDVNGAWLLMRLAPYQSVDGEPDGVLVTFVEVTRIKHAEETARVMSQTLRDANRSLTSQAEQLEDMFSIVAHDLRRPVLGLDGQLTLARETAGEGPVRAHLDAAVKTLGSLQQMLDDLSALARSGREPPAYDEVVLEEWFDALMSRFAPVADDRGVRLSGSRDTGRVVFARAAGEVALVNLVENAFQHGTGAEEPRIDVSCRTGQGRLTLIVSDNGRGIARADQGKIFQLFRRLHPEESEGTGVGLVSVRRMIQRAEGLVEVESRPGEGARFTVVLPTIVTSGARTRMLLVEDDDVDSSFVSRSLPELEVDVVRTLESARRFLGTMRYDLVMLDLTLPDGYGLDLLEDIRHHAPGAAVIVLTGLQGGFQLDAWDPAQIAAVLTKNMLKPQFVRELVAQYVELEAPR